MPFEVVRNDIVNMRVDAIVNTANPRPIVGAGTDAAIHAAAGPELLEARKRIGPILVGNAAITKAYELNADYVIHTVGPVWRGGLFGEETRLRRCYDAALQLALEQGCQSVAFPLISSGSYGFPKDKALQVAIAAFSEFLTHHEMQIFLVVFNREAFRLSEKLFRGVASFIDEHYVQSRETVEYRRPRQILESDWDYRASRRRWDREAPAPSATEEIPARSAVPAPRAMSLADMLKQEDAGFTETLLKLIDRSGKKDSQIYKKACLSKQHFSKIRNNPAYKPTKQTAIALALALELDLEQTKDLIGRAGYALTNSSKFDLIIRYFIEQKNYNVVEINLALYEFDQSLLGS